MFLVLCVITHKAVIHGASSFMKVIESFRLRNGVKQEWFKDGTELVIGNWIPMSDGIGCIDFDFREVKRYPLVGLLLAELNKGLNKPLI